MNTQTTIDQGSSRPIRWPAGVAAGVLAAAPIGMLLSYAGSLPFMLGLFFFALFGLVNGAIVFRVATPARPIPRTRLIVGSAVVVLVGWSIALVIEANEFPKNKAAEALMKIAPLPENTTAEQAKADVAAFVRRTFREQYGSDGVLGYARWVLVSGVMEYRVETMKYAIQLKPVQGRWWWAIRVLASAGLLAFGVYSQVSPLRLVADPPRRHVASDSHES